MNIIKVSEPEVAARFLQDAFPFNGLVQLVKEHAQCRLFLTFALFNLDFVESRKFDVVSHLNLGINTRAALDSGSLEYSHKCVVWAVFAQIQIQLIPCHHCPGRLVVSCLSK
jgi:hypothetical protein